MKSYLERYPTGFSGIIAAYLINLAGVFRRLKLYTDLRDQEDIFDLGPQTSKINYEPYKKSLTQEIIK